MLEVKGDLWEYEASYRCITTNGYVKKNGEAVMGRGCAKQAAEKWPVLPEILGEMISEWGNHVQWLGYTTYSEENETSNHAQDVISFPVKHHWREKADLDLIKRSAHELMGLLDPEVDANADVLLPRPGCGNGQLDWEDVKPVIEPILDDRILVITFA